MKFDFDPSHWALILGGSSGFGLATAQKLARSGMNVAVVHRNTRGAMPSIEREFDAIRATGVAFVAHNGDALSSEGRKGALDLLEEHLLAGDGKGRIRLLMHSLAYGNLKPLARVTARPQEGAEASRAALAKKLGIDEATLAKAVSELTAEGTTDALLGLAHPAMDDADSLLEDEDFAQTIYGMGTSLATWTHEVFARGLFASDARIIGITSEGNEIVWRGYAAVAAAKGALEAISRAIAVEFAPYGVRSNILQAGVSDTPALRLIPGSHKMKAEARARNPFRRLTTPADVAAVIALLCTDEAAWINGALIRVDGGERIAG